jgi:hypothetical protein
MVKQNAQTMMKSPTTKEKVNQLDIWEEAKGVLHDISADNAYLRIKLTSVTLRYRNRTQLANGLRTKLAGHQGEKVGILRCDDPTEPFLVQFPSD